MTESDARLAAATRRSRRTELWFAAILAGTLGISIGGLAASMVLSGQEAHSENPVSAPQRLIATIPGHKAIYADVYVDLIDTEVACLYVAMRGDVRVAMAVLPKTQTPEGRCQ